MENRLLRNEPDLAPYTLDDGEPISITELIPDPSPRPDTTLCEKEDLEQFEADKARFSAEIKDQPRLGELFNLLCDDVDKPRVLASRMEIPVTAVRNLRRQLRRRWRRCFPPAKTRNGSLPGHCDRNSAEFPRIPLAQSSSDLAE